VADLEGNLGAKEFYAMIKENGALGTDPAKLANIALALSKGGPEALGKAGVNLGDKAQYEALQQINRAAQGAFSEKGFDVAKYNKGLENERGAIDLAYESRKASQGYNDSYASPAILMKAMLKRRDIASSKIPGDEKAAEEKTGKSETDNIKSMNSLTAALESLRGYLVALTASIVGLTGALGAVVLAGGLGALASGGGGMLGKLGGMIPGKWNPISANQGPQMPGKPGFMSTMSD
jgi:hypothetical protein